MRQPLFKDKATHEAFERDGYVVIDFTTKHVVEEIAQLFYNLHPTIPDGFFCEVSRNDDELKNQVFKRMDDLLSVPMESTFIHYKKLGGTFLCKAPGDSGRVAVHQDWMVVDETKYASATVWIPCQDVDENNGALMVLPGSHNFFDKYRNNHIPVSYRGSEQLLHENMMTVPMKAGQAFVLNHAVLHASAFNATSKERLVIAYGITSADSPLSFYFREKDAADNKVEQFTVPDDFFLRYYNIGERPLIGEKVAEFQYEVPVVENDCIANMIYNEWKTRQSIPYFKDNWKLSENIILSKAKTLDWFERLKKTFS